MREDKRREGREKDEMRGDDRGRSKRGEKKD